MSFGQRDTMHDRTLDENESEKVIVFALNNEVNFFHTANQYSNGTSEEYLRYQFPNNQFVAKEKNLTPSSVMENHYNLLYRE